LEYNSTTGQAIGIPKSTYIFLAIALILILIALIWLLKIHIDRKIKQKMEEDFNNKDKP
jgi:hypothetical protein